MNGSERLAFVVKELSDYSPHQCDCLVALDGCVLLTQSEAEEVRSWIMAPRQERGPRSGIFALLNAESSSDLSHAIRQCQGQVS